MFQALASTLLLGIGLAFSWLYAPFQTIFSDADSKLSSSAALTGKQEQFSIIFDSIHLALEAHLATRQAQLLSQPALQKEEHKALQRAEYHEHLHHSRRAGVPAGRSRALTPVAAGSPYYVTGTDGLLSRQAIATLDLIGQRFHAELERQGLPKARFIVTSTFRSAARQAELRKVNANATHGQSSHEFGGSFDIAYEKFLPALPESSETNLYSLEESDLPVQLRSCLKYSIAARQQRWAEQMIAKHPQAYDAILARVLIQLEDQHALLALREYLQTCFHVTARVTQRA